MLALRTPAMLLRRSDYGESNRMLLLATRSAGTLSAVARSARKSVRRYGGALELFTVMDAELSRRTEEETWSLDRARVLSYHDGYASDMRRYSAGCYAVELFRTLVPHEMRDEAVFEWLVGFVKRWEHEIPDPLEMAREELALLDLLGHAPCFDRCAGCGREAPARTWARFDPVAGGILCSSCAGGRGFKVGSELRSLMMEAQVASRQTEAPTASEAPDAPAAREVPSATSRQDIQQRHFEDDDTRHVADESGRIACRAQDVRQCMDSFLREVTERESRSMPILRRAWGLD